MTHFPNLFHFPTHLSPLTSTRISPQYRTTDDYVLFDYVEPDAITVHCAGQTYSMSVATAIVKYPT